MRVRVVRGTLSVRVFGHNNTAVPIGQNTISLRYEGKGTEVKANLTLKGAYGALAYNCRRVAARVKRKRQRFINFR